MKLTKRFRAAAWLAWVSFSLGVAPGRLLEMTGDQFAAALRARQWRKVS